jgi:hypothetical protein
VCEANALLGRDVVSIAPVGLIVGANAKVDEIGLGIILRKAFWQAVEDLQDRGVIDKQHLEFLGELHGPTASLWAQQILNEVVVPYFDVAH